MVKYLEKEEDFISTIKEEKWLVDFYADWCGPCKMQGNILENVDFINILKINVDTFPNIASKFGVMSIPTLVFFKDGVEVHKEIGFRNIDELKDITNNM